MRFHASKEELQKMLTYVQEQLKATHCPPKEAQDLNLSIEEALVNVVSYAYPDKKGEVEIDIQPCETHYRITITDWGKPFNPLNAHVIPSNERAEARSIGGLGIHFIHTFVDHVHYERRENTNILTLSKWVGALV